MFDRTIFFLGYGCLGILPLVQLRLLWVFAPAQVIGKVLFATTVAVFLSVFCDANLSYRASQDSDHRGLEKTLRSAYCVRLGRLIAFAPLLVVVLLLRGDSPVTALAVLALSATYLLNYSFLYRNSGSVSSGLVAEFTLRILCQFFPIALSLLEGPVIGLALGCVMALGIQLIIVNARFPSLPLRIRPNFASVISHDFFSGLLGLIHASFCQLTAALILPADGFARFISVDRLVRAGLLIVEPCRLWFLRLSWTTKERRAVGTILGAATIVASFTLAAVSIFFLSGIAGFFAPTGLAYRPYLAVSFFVSFVSFYTLCAYVRYDFISLINKVLLTAILLGAMAYLALDSRGPFASALAFEGVAFGIVVLGTGFMHAR